MAEIEIIIDGEPEPIIYKEKDNDYINVKIITCIIQNYKNEQKDKDIIEFIRYLNPEYDAWVRLNEAENLKIKNGLKILVKLKEENENNIQIIKKKEIIDKINNLNNKIDEELVKLNNIQKLQEVPISTSFYLTKTNNISETQENGNLTINEEDSENDVEVDITVLTANPLVDNKEDDLYPSEDNNEYDLQNKKELKTMNDFNSITYSINQVIMDCNKQIRAQFLTLTSENLEFAISQKPKIIHLICKSYN